MFSNSTKYAIRAILQLSTLPPQERATVDELASVLDLPKAYLSKLLQQLSRADVISSSKGRGGGFFLSNSNLKRPLIDLIECLEGHNVLKKCLLGLPNCSDKNPCALHTYYKEFRIDLERVLMKESLRDLVLDSDLLNRIPKKS